MKAKVSASWCDLYYTYSTVLSFFFFFCSVDIRFLKLGGIWKRKKKWHTQAVQFLQLVVHMYFVPVKLFILEIKGKKNLYWKKKIVWPLNVASPWPGLEFGLFGGVKQFFFCLFCFCVASKRKKKRCLILILLGSLHVPHFVNQFQFSGGLGSSKSW